MAASNKEENIPDSDKITNLFEDWDNSDQSEDSDMECSGGEPSGTGDKPDSVSMFCKNCFTPYSGVQKSGTFVLKCQVCGLTDTILEEEASSLDAEEYVGNLMMNKFFQVLRDQENVNINIGDPDFADDNYKDITDAATDFCAYLNSMTAKLLEIAQAEKCGMDKNMSPNEVAEEVPDKLEVGQDDNDNDDKRNKQSEIMIGEDSTQEILALRSSVLQVIAFLIAKYNLPADIWITLENRLKNPDASEPDQDDSVNDEMNKSNNAEDELAENAEISYDAATDTEDAVGRNDDSDIDTEGVEISKLGEQRDEADDDLVKEKERDEGEESEEQKTIFGMQIGDVRAKLDDEIYGKLGSKFKMGDGDDADNESEERRGLEEENMSSPGDIVTFETDGNAVDEITVTDVNTALNREISRIWGTKFIFHHQTEVAQDPVMKSLLKNTNALPVNGGNRNETECWGSDSNVESNTYSEKAGSKDASEVKNIETNKTDNEGASSSNADVESEEFEVNFRAVSSAFLNELQSRKKDVLMKRKRKALDMVGAKLIAIKQQVKMVEKQVKGELHAAYKKKLKKTENQRQNLTERQKEIDNVEEMLNHYIATGQMDKVAELMREVQSLNQSN